jgi:hypothetical protein
VEKSCDDYNYCTKDFCDPVSGCHFVEPECLCDDKNECTIDSCLPEYGCINVVILCDDNDESTEDFCEAAHGCIFVEQGQGYNQK